MNQKLLACDVDGTILHHTRNGIDPKDIQAIKHLQSQGYLFAFCTGRTLTWIKPILEEHNLTVDALILCNGSLIYDGKSDFKLIENNLIPNKIALEIMEYSYQLGNYIIYWDDGQNTYEMKDRSMSLVTMASAVEDELSIFLPIEEAMMIKSDFATLGIAPITEKISDAEKTKEYILDRWGKHITATRNQFFLDISPLDSSKGAGITKLLKHWQKDVEVYAVGDSLNDLSMFQTVGKDHAFWMKNGDKELMSITDYHVNSVAECIDIILSKK